MAEDGCRVGESGRQRLAGHNGLNNINALQILGEYINSKRYLRMPNLIYTGWVALVRVDGTTYTVMGGDLIRNSSTQLSIDVSLRLPVHT